MHSEPPPLIVVFIWGLFSVLVLTVILTLLFGGVGIVVSLTNSGTDISSVPHI